MVVPAVPTGPAVGLTDAARAVRSGLLSAGQPVNRRTLGECLQAAGYGVRNDRLGALCITATVAAKAAPFRHGK